MKINVYFLQITLNKVRVKHDEVILWNKTGSRSVITSLQDWTGTVSIAVVRTVAVLRAGVPAPTLGHLIGRLAGLAVSSEHVALATPELVWLLISKRIKILLQPKLDDIEH